jgi:hypothetical protein
LVSIIFFSFNHNGCAIIPSYFMYKNLLQGLAQSYHVLILQWIRVQLHNFKYVSNCSVRKKQLGEGQTLLTFFSDL